MVNKIKTIIIDPNEGVQIVSPKKKKSKIKPITIDPNEGIQIVSPKKKQRFMERPKGGWTPGVK